MDCRMEGLLWTVGWRDYCGLYGGGITVDCKVEGLLWTVGWRYYCGL